jgi:hypothetical protein
VGNFSNIQRIEESIGEKLALFIYYSSAFVACTITALYNGWELTMVSLFEIWGKINLYEPDFRLIRS